MHAQSSVSFKYLSPRLNPLTAELFHLKLAPLEKRIRLFPEDDEIGISPFGKTGLIHSRLKRIDIETESLLGSYLEVFSIVASGEQVFPRSLAQDIAQHANSRLETVQGTGFFPLRKDGSDQEMSGCLALLSAQQQLEERDCRCPTFPHLWSHFHVTWVLRLATRWRWHLSQEREGTKEIHTHTWKRVRL